MTIGDRFLGYVGRMNMDHFLGLCRFFSIDVFEKKEDCGKSKIVLSKDFEEVLVELIDKFESLPRSKRREITKLCKEICEGDRTDD